MMLKEFTNSQIKKKIEGDYVIKDVEEQKQDSGQMEWWLITLNAVEITVHFNRVVCWHEGTETPKE